MKIIIGFDDVIYSQSYGVAMSSPLGINLFNSHMTHIENIFDNFAKTIIYLRYINHIVIQAKNLEDVLKKKVKIKFKISS